jgi:hypothetical protein
LPEIRQQPELQRGNTKNRNHIWRPFLGRTCSVIMIFLRKPVWNSMSQFSSRRFSARISCC